MGCCAVVSQSEYAVVERFGRFDRFIGPGLSYISCCTERVAYTQSLRMSAINIVTETVTSDSVSVTVKVGVHYRIRAPVEHGDVSREKDYTRLDGSTEMRSLTGNNRRNALDHYGTFEEATQESPLYKAIYACRDLPAQMRQLVEGHMRSVSRDYTMAEMFQSKNVISDGILQVLHRELAQFGIEIHLVLITDIDPPQRMKDSMSRVLQSQNARDAMINQAEAEKRAAILKAEGAFAVRKLEGEAIAAQREAIVSGLREITGEVQDDAALTQTMIMMQYLDVLSQAASNGKNTYIMPCTPSAIVGIEQDLQSAVRAHLLAQPRVDHNK